MKQKDKQWGENKTKKSKHNLQKTNEFATPGLCLEFDKGNLRWPLEALKSLYILIIGNHL